MVVVDAGVDYGDTSAFAAQPRLVKGINACPLVNRVIFRRFRDSSLNRVIRFRERKCLIRPNISNAWQPREGINVLIDVFHYEALKNIAAVKVLMVSGISDCSIADKICERRALGDVSCV